METEKWIKNENTHADLDFLRGYFFATLYIFTKTHFLYFMRKVFSFCAKSNKDPEKIKSIFREEREKFDIIPKKQKSLYITKKSYRMLMFLKRELYISRGFVMQIAIEQYYNYLCSDEYLTLLINKRNEVLKENSVCNQ